MQEIRRSSQILIIDDDLNNLKITGLLLRQYDYKVLVAKEGTEALNLLEKIVPDLILLDIMMPGMDGMQLCKLLKQDERFSDIPVIFLTALDDAENMIKALDYGGVDYVTKPVNKRELIARVKTHIELKLKNEKLKNINGILEQKIAERTRELQEANQELMLLDEAKSEFLSIISHEIRTPLNGIIGFSEIIKMKCNVDDIQNHINMLNLSLERLERFSLNALLLTALRTDKRKMVVSNFKINDIIDRAFEKAKNSFLFREANIQNRLEESHTVTGDEGLLYECFLNLIGCALQLSNKNKDVIVSANKEGKDLICEMKTLGSNILDDDIKNIFKLFKPGKSFSEGNEGLCFPLCKQIMKLHDGDLEVSNYEQGVNIKLIFTS